MRILIVQPATNPHVWGGDAIFVMEPLWAEYMGAALKPEHEVKLLDLRLGGDLEETQASFKPDILAMTAYTVDVNTVKRLSRECKARNPQLKTAVGGYHAELKAEDFSVEEIDFIVLGEGTFTMVDIANALENGKPVQDIPGVAIPIEGGGLHRAPARPWPHLDDFPFPDRTLTADIRDQYFDKWMKPIASIRSSYGCPYRCEFCILWPPLDGKYMSRSPESFVDELEAIEEDHVFFTDDEAMIQPRRMNEIADLIKERGIEKSYYFMTRSDSIKKYRDVFEKWASIGLKRVLIGLESSRPQDLEIYNKGATMDDNNEAIAICAENGVEIQAMFVLNPDCEKEDFAALQEFVDRSKLDTPVYTILTPYPGTDSYKRYEDQIIVDDYDYWDLLHAVIPTKMPLDDFYTEFSKLWGTIPALQRGILAHRDSLPAEQIMKNLLKMRQGIRQGAQE